MNWQLLGIILAVALIWVLATPERSYALPQTVSRLVVVELFTSQGCSSCPPADEVLADLATNHSDVVLPLSYHVDYWNYIGWNDPFSSPAFSERQRAYSQKQGKNRVYTPQMVVDGWLETVGSQRSNVYRLIERAAQEQAHIPITLTQNGAGYDVTLGASNDPSFSHAIVQLVAFQRKHTTQITRGENSGETLTNYNIVRSVTTIGSWDGTSHSVHIDTPQTDDFAIIVQSPQTGRIIGAATTKPSDFVGKI